MTITSGIVVYVVSWWLIFFMALPIGVKPPHEQGEKAQAGNDAGAPTKPFLGMKIVAATLGGGVVTGLIYWVIISEIITFRNV